MIRTFVAIHLTPQVVTRLAVLARRLGRQPGGEAWRWVRPENMHLTLKFLGDVPSSDLAQIFGAVDHVCQSAAPLTLGLTGMGCFPNSRNPHVLWVGVRDESHYLASLARGIDGKLASLGFRRETRPFRPHLTLARARRNASRNDAACLGIRASHSSTHEIASFAANAVYVVRSDLGHGGARYTDIHRAQLLGGSKG